MVRVAKMATAFAAAGFLTWGAFTPQVAHADFNQGMILLQQKYFDEAAAQFQAEVKRNKKLDKAWYYLGKSYVGAKKYNEAVDALKQAVALDPQEYDYQIELAGALLKAKQYDAAQAAFGKAYSLAPDNDAKYLCAFTQGKVLTALKRYDEAATVLKKAQKHKNNYNVAMYLGQAESKIGNYAGAAKAFESALRYQSTDKQALQGVTFAYVKLAIEKGKAGDKAGEESAWKAAAVWSGKGAAAMPKDAEMASLYANALFRSDQFSKAVGAYDKAIALAPDDCAIRTEQGLAYFKLKNWPKTEETLTAAISCDKQNHSALSFLGYTYNEMAQPLQKKGLIDGKEDLELLQQAIAYRVKALDQFSQAMQIKNSRELADAAKKVNANVQVLRENIEIIMENRQNDSDYETQMARYKAQMEAFEEHNRKVEEYKASTEQK